LLAVHRGPELASYYVVAEALISAAKHADAPAVTVSGCGDDDDLSLYVTDDGVGGADVRSDRG
jgi:signal transduction histidine kinase